MTRPYRIVIAAIIAAILVAPAPVALASDRAVTLDPAESRVTFTLDTTFHEVHGTMVVQGGSIRFDTETGAASGTITVDAHSAQTGNGKRDRTMHADVLETAKFPLIVFRAERVEGTLVDPGHSTLRLVGVMSLHGADHPMTLPATVDSSGGKVQGTIEFPIPYVEWGLKDPSFLVARAAKTVEVTVVAAGRWSDGVAAR